MKEKIIFAILISSLVVPSALGVINYNPQNCRINNCPVTITDCSNGLADIYLTSTCVGNPSFEYSFSGGNFPWLPDKAGTYYLYVLCDDGHIYSGCSQVVVSSLATTSTTTTDTSHIPTSETTPTPGGNNTVLYVLVVIIIVVIAFIAYRLFVKKKKPRINYETLYRRWGR
jgi:hypothetical protein